MNSISLTRLERGVVVVCVFLALFYPLSTLYGALLNHSSVPHSDTWEGAINFFLESKVDVAAWWNQHFDHRIFLAKVFFWIDLSLLGGRGLIYVPLHISLLAIVGVVYFGFYRKIVPTAYASSASSYSVVALCLIFSFAWMQRENIVWEFQSQFILAYLLPLVSFYLYAKSRQEGSLPLYATSLVASWLCSYTMVNGILILPLIIVAGFLCRDSLKNILLAVVVSFFSIATFFVGYEETPGRAFGYSMIVNEPFKVLLYALVYIGNPVFWVTKSIGIAAFASASMIIYLGFLIFQNLKSKNNAFYTVLLVYMLYICMTAGLTAFGRSLFPVELAASSRYTTPGLTFWMIATLVVVCHNATSAKSLFQLFAFTALFFAVFFLRSQVSSLYYTDPVRWLPFTKEVTALALQLGIDDQNAKRSLYPISDRRDSFFERARAAGISIFSPEMMYPASMLGRSVNLDWSECNIQIRRFDLAEEKRGVNRVKGSINAPSKQYSHVFFVDADGVVVGMAITGVPNIGDVSAIIPELKWVMSPKSYDMFDGYIFASSVERAFCN